MTAEQVLNCLLPAVAAVIPGPNAPEQARQNLEWVRASIPRELWAELKAEGLLRADAPTR